MKIRTANPEDASAIAHIHVSSWQATYPGMVAQSYLDSLDEGEFTERWRDWLVNHTSVTVCVAEADGLVFGFASGGAIRKPVSHYDGELYALYLLPGMQRKGAGRKLVETIAGEMLRQGRSHLLVWVLRQNPATSFYERIGARFVAEDTVEIAGSVLAEVAYGWSDSVPGPRDPASRV